MKKIVLVLGILLANNLSAEVSNIDDYEDICRSAASFKRCRSIVKENIAKCLGGNVGACDIVGNAIIAYVDANTFSKQGVHQSFLKAVEMKCNVYMKVLKKGCTLGSGISCALLGDEYHSISVYYNGYWRNKYGANCSLKNGDEAFKFYKKACNLGESWGCQRYSEFEMDLAEIQARERDKTQKSDITIRRK